MVERNTAKMQSSSGEARVKKSPTPRQESGKGVEVDLTNQRALSKKKSGIVGEPRGDDSMISQLSANPQKGLVGLGSARDAHEGKLSDIDLTGAINTGGLRNVTEMNKMNSQNRTKSPVESEQHITGYGDGILAISNNMCDNSEQNSPSASNHVQEAPSFAVNYPLRPPQIQNFASTDGMTNFSQTLNQQQFQMQQNS